MAKWLVVLLGGLFIAACDRGAVSSGPDCASAANGVTASLADPKEAPAAADVKNAKAAVQSLCTTAKWTSDARSCMAKAKTPEQEQDCAFKQLTGEQAAALDKAAAPLSMSSAAAMKAMEEFAGKMCQCRDAKCAQVVSDEMTKWSMEMAKKSKEPPRMSEEDLKKATELGQRMGECMQKAMATGMGELNTDVPQIADPQLIDPPAHQR